MAGVIDGMIQKGLLERDDERGRGRANPVTLTETGSATLATAWPAFAEASRPTALGLTEAEGRQLNQMLHRLRELPE
jgi:DNA-binding MarR family transcriptional regulator